MSEFLVRGWNVATPEVDIGDDIFVVQDESGTLRRVQVKTSIATVRKNGYSAQFNIPLVPLKNIASIAVHYVLLVRHLDVWTKPLIIRQDYLLDHWQNDNIGSEYRSSLILYLTYSKNKVLSKNLDLTKYISDYTDFPIIQ